MRSLLILALLAPILFLPSCKKEIFALNEEVSIGINSSIQVQAVDEILKIQFSDLIEDSRCPPNTNCFWEGIVRVKLRLNDSDNIELGLGANMISSASYSGQTIELLDVIYDSDDDFGDEKKCSVVVRVN